MFIPPTSRSSVPDIDVQFDSNENQNDVEENVYGIATAADTSLEGAEVVLFLIALFGVLLKASFGNTSGF